MSIDVGERLRFVRGRHKLSQRELAKRSGVTNSTISLIESNQMNPSVGALKRILDGIPMGMAEFFALEPDRPRKAFYRADELTEIGKGTISFRQIGDNRCLRIPELRVQYVEPCDVVPPEAATVQVFLYFETVSANVAGVGREERLDIVTIDREPPLEPPLRADGL